MSMLTRRDFLTHLSAGAAVFGLSHILDPNKALATTPDMVESMIAGQTPKQGGILTYGQTYPNWALGQSSSGSHPFYWLDLLTRSVWNALTWVDEDLNIQLELASEITPSDDLKVWDVTVHEGVMFHDGTELTAKDVLSTYQFLLSKGNLRAYRVDSVEQAGPYTVRFILESGNAELPYMLAEYRNMIMKANDDFEKIGFDGIGTGPFKLIEIDPARQFRAERFDDYWMGAPYLDELRGVLALGSTAINGFRAGQLNAVWNIDPGQIEQYEAANGLIHASAAGDQFWLVMPKNLNFPWNDVRVRKAMSLAIDRPAINRIVYRDPDGWTGNDSHMTGVNKEFVPRTVERDVDQAKALLAEAGYPNGVDLPAMVFCPSFPEEPRIYPIVSESLAEAGIKLAFNERPCDGFNPFVNAVNSPIGRPRRNLVGPRNPIINLSRASQVNAAEPGGWEGPESDAYTKLIFDAVGTLDEKRREEMYREAQGLLQENVPGVMLGGRRNMVAHASNVKNARSHSQNWSSRFEYIWIDS